MKPPREVLVVKLYCCKTTKVCTIQDIGEGELTEFIEHSAFLELQKERDELKNTLKHDVDKIEGQYIGKVKALEEQCEKLAEALNFYTNYHIETVRHMDTEFLQPERIAVIKPIDKIQSPEGYAPDGMHPSQIHQDALFTYGPKQRPGKIAREALSAYREWKGKHEPRT